MTMRLSQASSRSWSRRLPRFLVVAQDGPGEAVGSIHVAPGDDREGVGRLGPFDRRQYRLHAGHSLSFDPLHASYDDGVGAIRSFASRIVAVSDGAALRYLAILRA
jgi:hypothetical protein